MSEFIKTNFYNQVAVITLDRPEALNALNHDMILTLKERLTRFKKDDSIQCVFIHGNGRAFCAGGDIRDLYYHGINNIEKSMRYFRDEYRLNQLIYHYPKPYIAYLDGITMGGGVGISLHGSHRIATPHFSFAMPETKIGFFPDIGSRYHLTRLRDSIGLYLALSSHSLTAGQAKKLGLSTHLTESNQAKSIIEALAKHTCINDALKLFEIEIPEEPELSSDLLRCYEHDSLVDIYDALKKVDPNLAKDLSQKSLFSLEITFQSYQDAIGQGFDDIIEEELEITHLCLAHPDFYEGVRALLIDKDKNPRWKKRLN
jgi:enoyl-CoA hydratase/carnithine racemase